MWQFAQKARLKAFGNNRSTSAGALSTDASDATDALLLRRLEQLCPGHISLSTKLETAWVEDSLGHNDDASNEFAIIPSLGDWTEVKTVGSQLVQKQPDEVAAEAKRASVGIQRELQWYFQERDSRILGFRSSPLEKPCARTLFARHLLRYAATTLLSADQALLEAWCSYLAVLIKERPFSSSNLLWPSRFEKSLEACLARLERLLSKVKGNGFPELTLCPVDKQAVTRAMVRRDTAGTLSAVPVERFGIWRQITKVDGVLSKVQSRVPLLPGLQTLAFCNSWAASIIFGTACMELMATLAVELRSYSTGEVDAQTLTEDIFVASGSAAAFALGRYTSAFFAVGDGFAALMVDQLGPSSAAFFMSILLRAAGQEIQGGPRMRALRNAYASLGLSPSGALVYTPEEIEAQLAFRLRRPGRTDRTTLRLWAAYSYIREHQHPELKDPWGHIKDVCEDAGGIDYAAACEVLEIDPHTTITSAELRRRYLRLSLMHHPDRPKGDHDTYLRLHAAYELLRCYCQQ